ncbi:MAG: DUF6544 family protein [Nocardioides sp.]
MRSFVRWAVGVTVVCHGLIHLMGAAEGLGVADVSWLAEPIGTAMGVVWLGAAVFVVAAGTLIVTGSHIGWAIAVAALTLSQAAILTSWNDAKAGTLGNVVLVIAAVYGFRSQGPTGYRAQYRRIADESIAASTATGSLVTEGDLARLPAPVAAYLRSAGTVGRPRVTGFHADISGRIRGGPDDPWMSWTGEQVNTFGHDTCGRAPSRVFFMDATKNGIPVEVLHVYRGHTATMRIRVAAMKTVVDAHGPELDRAETVTVLNDMCVLAPAALLDASIEWTPIDDRHTRATYTAAGYPVSAVLTFDGAGDLVDFVSDDRFRASADGRTFTAQRWSTPITGYREFDGRRIGSIGAGRWHSDGEPGFDYLEFHTDRVTYLEATSPADQCSPSRHVHHGVRSDSGPGDGGFGRAGKRQATRREYT